MENTNKKSRRLNLSVSVVSCESCSTRYLLSTCSLSVFSLILPDIREKTACMPIGINHLTNSCLYINNSAGKHGKIVVFLQHD